MPSAYGDAMKRRSRAGGEPIKGRRRKAPEPKRGNAPKAPAGFKPSPANEETAVARLTHDLREALEQQTATSEVLRVISSYPGDPQPVFQAMLKNAVRLCDAKFGNIYSWDGDALHLVATENAPTAFAEARRRASFRPSPKTPTGRMIANKKVVHIADLRAEKAYVDRDPWIVAGVELASVRTVLMVPMLKENELIGAFSVYRQEVRPFTDKQITLVSNFAAQAVIAIENARLLNELRQRTTDLTERTADLTEALEQQTATSEVLQVISSFAGELDPVFQAILANATRICEAEHGALFLFSDGTFQPVAAHGASAALPFERLRVEPAPGTGLGRMVSAKAAIQIADVLTDEDFPRDHPLRSAAERRGVRTLLCVPMIKEGELIGAISFFRQEVRPFTDKQIELVKNFAAQAVIAIENARLLNELRQRTGDLTEALEQQTGTSELLQVISSSSGDLEPVFATMLENAVSICDATFGNIYRVEGDGLRIVATHHTPAVFAEARRTTPYFSPGPKNPVRRMMTTKSVVHVDDVAATEAYTDREPAAVASVELGGTRTLMIVPMLKENELVGACMLARQEVCPFNNKQMELVTNFAAQAVIAIENARLLNELRQRTTDLTERTADLTEALEQQTATSEVLQAISGSPGDLQPVFAIMLRNMVRVCHASFGAVHRCHGDLFQFVAEHNSPSAYANLIRHSPFRPGPHHYFGPMIASKSVEQFADLAASQGYLDRRPEFVTAVELGGVRTGLNVPMLKENELIGAFALARKEVRPFTDKQIELVKNFAAQAVIAIENARLLNELRQRTTDLTERTADLTEALEQQTATSEVLEAISRSPGGLEPVFQAMLEKAVRICDAKFGSILRWDNEAAHLVATHNAPPAFTEARRRSTNPANPKTSFGRMVATKAVVHVADAAAEPGYVEQHDPAAVAAVELGGQRTALYVPMLKEGELIGAFTLSRQDVRPFTDKQIELVQNFAAQAVIAIENARLLNELRDRTEEVEKLNKHLEQRVTDQVGEIERMSRLRRFLPPQVADLIVASGSEKQLESHRREITALFCDLRGFTGFTESADAEDVMALLRDYHAAIGEIIIKYNGTLERYAGDGVMVVFNDPVPVENPALQAVLMALEVRDAIGALTETWRRLGHEIGFGIGIAHGFATLGTIGFEGRFDYAAIGTVSNVASRLCDEAKPGQILISARVLMKVENAVKVEPVGEFELKGIRRPLAAYNVVGALGSWG
jgi:GAF domain-containing protein